MEDTKSFPRLRKSISALSLIVDRCISNTFFHFFLFLLANRTLYLVPIVSSQPWKINLVSSHAVMLMKVVSVSSAVWCNSDNT